MGYYVSNVIAIRVGGVFGGGIDIKDFKKRICKVAKELDMTVYVDWERLGWCMSKELHGDKGSYIVIAGVFNAWSWPISSKLARALSKEFGTEVMHTCWDEQTNNMNFAVFLDGKSLDDAKEGWIARIIRRIS